jgi:uncharacterized membrane protein (DUF4010 family)
LSLPVVREGLPEGALNLESFEIEPLAFDSDGKSYFRAVTQTESDLFLRYGISLAIGILVGMQREFASGGDDREQPAGVRTFGLIALLGCGAAHVTQWLNSAIPLGAAMILLASLLTGMYLMDVQRGKPGLTTEIAAAVTFLAGVLALEGHMRLAGALGVVTTTILSLKLELHTLARKMTKEDVFATLKFAMLGVVILPLLPNRSYLQPPFDLINPFKIGFFVVLMLGVQFVGYILAKLLGARRGIGMMGLVGGLVSSTAVTLSFTQRSRNEPAHSGSLSLAILASWCVMLARTLGVVFALNPEVLLMAWAPLTAALVAGLGFCLFLLLRPRQAAEAEAGLFENPFELGPALRFGLLFVVILVASRWAQTAFGNLGMYLSSFMAGLLDVDAISFTMSRMASQGGVDAATAANAVLLAALANTLLKGGMSIALGSPSLRRVMAPGTLLMLAAGTLAAWLV